MLRPCPSCPCRTRKIRSRTNRVVTGRLSRRRVARVAVTAARTPRVGRTEGRRTLSVARNLGPARGASATARTPRAGSAVSRGVAAHATLHLEAQTEAIAALAVPGTAVDPCVSRDGSGHSGDRPTEAHSDRFVGRHVTRPTALLGAFCAGRCADLWFRTTQRESFTYRTSRSHKKISSDCVKAAKRGSAFGLFESGFPNRGRRVSDVRARNSPVCKVINC